MPVIINEFEVIAEPPEPAGMAPAEQESAPAGPQPLRPVDIIRIQEYHQQRIERLAAD